MDSPYTSWPAYAPIVEAMAGIYEPTRKPGQPPPVVVAGALGDNGSALFAIIGTLAALLVGGLALVTEVGMSFLERAIVPDSLQTAGNEVARIAV